MKNSDTIFGKSIFFACVILGGIAGIILAIETHPPTMDIVLGVFAFCTVGVIVGAIVGTIMMLLINNSYITKLRKALCQRKK